MHRASKARRSTADCSSHHYDNDSGAAYVHQNGLRTASQLSTNLWCTLRYLHQVTLTSASGQNGKAQCEQMFSALPLKPDIAEYGPHVRLVPILLQKSFC